MDFSRFSMDLSRVFMGFSRVLMGVECFFFIVSNSFELDVM